MKWTTARFIAVFMPSGVSGVSGASGAMLDVARACKPLTYCTRRRSGQSLTPRSVTRLRSIFVPSVRLYRQTRHTSSDRCIRIHMTLPRTGWSCKPCSRHRIIPSVHHLNHRRPLPMAVTPLTHALACHVPARRWRRRLLLRVACVGRRKE